MKPKVSKPKMYDGPAYYKAMSGRWVVLDHFGQKVGEAETEADARHLFEKLSGIIITVPTSNITP